MPIGAARVCDMRQRYCYFSKKQPLALPTRRRATEEFLLLMRHADDRPAVIPRSAEEILFAPCDVIFYAGADARLMFL